MPIDLTIVPDREYVGKANIARRMGKSVSTLDRYRNKMGFPCYIRFVHGRKWRIATTESLYMTWLMSRVKVSRRLLNKGERRSDLHESKRREGENRETDKALPATSPSAPVSTAAGTPSRSKVDPEKAPTPSLQEELDKLGPVERAWVINHELTPAQLDELGIKLPETPKTSITRKCTCGTEIECRAHD